MRFTFCKHGLNIRVKFNASMLTTQAAVCELESEDDSIEYCETLQWSHNFGHQTLSAAELLPTRMDHVNPNISLYY